MGVAYVVLVKPSSVGVFVSSKGLHVVKVMFCKPVFEVSLVTVQPSVVVVVVLIMSFGKKPLISTKWFRVLLASRPTMKCLLFADPRSVRSVFWRAMVNSVEDGKKRMVKCVTAVVKVLLIDGDL